MFRRWPVVRQLYDFKQGARAGANSALMRPVAEALTMDDMIALAACVASLPPQIATSQ
jgi:cytochrome c553